MSGYNLRSSRRRNKKSLSSKSEEETEKGEIATPSKCMKVSEPNQGVNTKANKMEGLGSRSEGKAESDALVKEPHTKISNIVASYDSNEEDVGLGRNEEGQTDSDVSSISSEDEPHRKIRKITTPYVHNGVKIGIESQDIFTMETRTLSEQVALNQFEADSIPKRNDDSSHDDTIVTPTKAIPVSVEQLKASEEEKMELDVSSISLEDEPRSKLAAPYVHNGVKIGIESQDIFTMETRTLSEQVRFDQFETGNTIATPVGYLRGAKLVPVGQLKAIQQICPSSIRQGKLNYIYKTHSYKDFSRDSSTGSAISLCERPVRCYKLGKNTFQTHAIKAGCAFNRMVFDNVDTTEEEESSSSESELSFTSFVEGMDIGLITDELGNIGMERSEGEGPSGVHGMGIEGDAIGMSQTEKEGPSRAGGMETEGSHQINTRQDNVVEFDKGMDEVDEMLSRKAVRSDSSAIIKDGARKEILSRRINKPSSNGGKLSSNGGTTISRNKQSTDGAVGWRALIRTRVIPTSPTKVTSRRFGSESSFSSSIGAKLTQLARIKRDKHTNHRRLTTPINDGTINRTDSLETAKPNQNQEFHEMDVSSGLATEENKTRANQEIDKRLPTKLSTQSKATSASKTDTRSEVSRKLYYPIGLIKALHSFQSKEHSSGCSVVPSLPQRCAHINQDNKECDNRESAKPQDHPTTPILTNSSCSEHIATPTNETTANEQNQMRPISLETIMTNDYTLPGDIANIVNKYWLFRVNS